MNQTLDEQIRSEFPILSTQMHGKPLVYLDNGATTQKPKVVIDAICNYYSNDNANIHRGIYELSQRASDGFEGARKKVAEFLNAAEPAECIFVRGTTEAINLVAMSWGGQHLVEGDEVILTGMEHHSNIIPWQFACDRVGAKLRVLKTSTSGELNLDELREMVSERTKMVSVQHVSNALGTVHDVNEIIAIAKGVGAKVLIDGAQWIAHAATDVQQLGCDFYVFSAHKLYGPTGIGVLWGRRELLEQMPPYQGGGDMIETVAFEESTFAPLPNKFEAGTPNIAGAIGLGAAIDFVSRIGFNRIAEHEHQLLEYATGKLEELEGLRIIGTAKCKAAVISFVIDEPSIAPLDIATALSNEGIAIRAGHHCCMPLMNELDLVGTSRASFAMYNSRADVDALVAVLNRLIHARRERGKAEPQRSTNGNVDIEFGAQAGPNIEAAANDLAEEFLMFDDPESKTELLMELGQELPSAFDQLKAISTAVPGCMSEVYLVGRPKPDSPEVFEFAADSNAEIVRGLIAVLIKLFSGQPASDVLAFDTESFFRRIGLEQFISTQRRSGLDGMLKRVQFLASSITEREG